MTKFNLIFLLLFANILNATSLIIDDKTKVYDLLTSSQVYMDKTRSLTIKDISSKNIEFKDNDKSLLGYGYSPNFDIWIKFTLKNNSDKTIHKILEYANSMTTDIIFYDLDNNISIKEGHLNTMPNRSSINPTFKLTLQPYQTKTYYIKASSYITTLIVKLNLYNNDDFYTKEIKHQVILALFFGAMLILAIYNLFIFFFSKDISYLFYVFYIFGITIHHTLYVGVANLYIFDSMTMRYIIQFASLFIAFPIFFLALFSKSFLQINKYPILNKILNILLVLFILSLLLFIATDTFNTYRNILPMLLLFYLITVSIYLSYKRNRQAYFVVSGWLILAIGGITMYFSSIGVINIYQSFPYIVEVSLLLEAILFSIALSDKINSLQKDKIKANQKLIEHKKTENKRLEIQVDEKTKDLNISLDEKTLLLKELNHRVKNNMQTIVSLIRLQADDIEDESIQNLFITIQNRINAMSHLHELLHKQENVSNINAYEYFMVLIEGLEDSYENEINIHYKIDVTLEIEQAVSCGLILNELITNSFKYAFENNNGNISISLNKTNGVFNLVVTDDGVGYDDTNSSNSFGLVLVKTLVESQLKGTISTNTTNGVEVKIIWRDDE
ncbi:MAG: 7TM diverse intracellular signaling domain-containing protein [Campylobacterota bacterium]|nr:7TM diverse intracellular signaling domain-containing protein [Campylobacterota bacterium]